MAHFLKLPLIIALVRGLYQIYCLQINEFVHKRTVTRRLIASDVNSARSFEWLCEMRFYFDPRNNDVSKSSKAIYYAGYTFKIQFKVKYRPIKCLITV